MPWTRRSFVALIGIGLAHPALAAGKTVRVGGRPVWIPDGWTVIETGARLMAGSPDELTYLVANERAVPVEGLAGVNPADFIFDRVSSVKPTADKLHVVNGERVRTVTGTGVADGQPVQFWFRIAAGRSNLVTVLVYAQTNMPQTTALATVTRILNSISA